jgi:hypothetical protein
MSGHSNRTASLVRAGFSARLLKKDLPWVDSATSKGKQLPLIESQTEQTTVFCDCYFHVWW